MGLLAGLLNGSTRTRVERFCSELGWESKERYGKATVGVHFNCPVVGRRTICITDKKEDGTCFWALADTTFDPDSVPDSVTKFAFWRNSQCQFGKWEPILDNGELSFQISHTAFALSPAVVKCICECLANEAAVFDQKMKEEGYL